MSDFFIFRDDRGGIKYILMIRNVGATQVNY